MDFENNNPIHSNDIADGSSFSADSNDAIIKVIGVGGGGGNAINYMYKQNIKNINYVVCNTDKQALEMSPVPVKLILGKEITHGRGAGNNPELGRQCAEASEEEIRELFNDQTEMVFITAGMGGGTGTGAAPVVARIAKDMGILTIGIVTVPFLFEGDKKILKAIDGANEMKQHVDALLVINNENLIDIYQDLNFFNAFDKADDTLANAARSISEIISEKCYINVDFQDVKTTLKDSGTAIISTAYGEGENRISDAFHNAFHSPLLKTHDIKTSKRLLFKFSCSKDCEHPIAAREINEIRQFTAKLPSNLDVKWGIADDPELGDKVKITVLASGFDVTLKDDIKSGTHEENVFVFRADSDDGHDSRKQKTVSDEDTQRRIADVYGQEKMARQLRDTAKIKYAVLEPSQFDDHEIIALLERNPTFNREPRFNDLLKNISRHELPSAPTSHGSGKEITF
ncbi:MAG: cell division protein FtsZ [Clostridium sp.]|nr:cell division protein FtsZ [Prevotella sp.]MCM1429593.1 cell division protein FtsZ [Clostridium sp.]MCM1476072.1 cell division protein FtsZ [Muribaculaceae bacterium]